MIDLKIFSDLIHVIYSQALDTPSTPSFTHHLKQAFNADCTWLINKNNDDIPFFCSNKNGPSQDKLTALTKDLLSNNSHDTTAQLSTLKSDHKLISIAADNGFADLLAINIAINNNQTIIIGMAKNTATGTFSNSANKALSNLTRHFQQAQTFRDHFSSHRVERNVFADAMNNLMMGVIVLDKQGKVVATNRVAREMIAQYGAFMIQQEVFQLEDKALYKKLAQTINEVGQQLISTDSNSQNNSRVINVPVSSHYHIGIVVHPLRSEDTSSKASVALFLRNPEEQLNISTDALIELFDLTQSEARVAAEIANGLTMDEISQRLSISKNTVKTHLKTTFEKTGVKRQQALIRLIFNSVAHLVSKNQLATKNE